MLRSSFFLAGAQGKFRSYAAGCSKAICAVWIDVLISKLLQIMLLQWCLGGGRGDGINVRLRSGRGRLRSSSRPHPPQRCVFLRRLRLALCLSDCRGCGGQPLPLLRLGWPIPQCFAKSRLGSSWRTMVLRPGSKPISARRRMAIVDVTPSESSVIILISSGVWAVLVGGFSSSSFVASSYALSASTFINWPSILILNVLSVWARWGRGGVYERQHEQ